MLHIKLKGVERSTIFFSLNLHLHPFFVYASSEGPSKTGHLFAWLLDCETTVKRPLSNRPQISLPIIA